MSYYRGFIVVLSSVVFMIKFVVKTGDQKNICYDETRLYAQNKTSF